MKQFIRLSPFEETRILPSEFARIYPNEGKVRIMLKGYLRDLRMKASMLRTMSFNEFPDLRSSYCIESG